MDELLSVLGEIRDQLIDLNNKVDRLTGIYDVSDIIDAINDIKGSTGYNLTDIHEKVESVTSAVEKVTGIYDLDDIYRKLDSIEEQIFLKD